MKRTILRFATLGLVIGAITFTGCKKDDGEEVVDNTGGDGNNNQPKELVVPQTSMPIVNKLTATWCPPCGGWGWTLLQDIIDAQGEKAVIMGTYGSSTSEYYHNTAQAFKTQFAPTAGWPAFCVNGKNETQYSSNGNIYTGQTLTQCINVCDNFAAQSPTVQTGFRYSVKEGNIEVETKTKFFENGDGNYYLGVYVIEDGVVGKQAGHTPSTSAEHHYVLRNSQMDIPWGKQIAEGEVAAGTTFDNVFSIPVDNKWNMDKVKVAVIMWDKNIYNKYIFVNANNKAQKD